MIAAVERGDVDLGLVPIENSIEGSVNVTLDTLAFEDDLLIQREIVTPVALNLLARPGTRLSRRADRRLASVRRIAQCRDWLAAQLARRPRLVAANSTAEAAETRRASRRPGVAAIGTRLAAELYGLDVLADDIEDHPENTDPVRGASPAGIPAPTGHDKTSIVVFQRGGPAGLAARDPPGVRGARRSTCPARVAADQDERSATTASSSTRGPRRRRGGRRLPAQPAAKQADVKFLGSYPAAGETARRAAGGRQGLAGGGGLDRGDPRRGWD